MGRIGTLAVFAGSAPGRDRRLVRAVHNVGDELARRGITVVYGGGGTGLMGALSQGALHAGGRVVGVIPRSMVEREWGRHDLAELHVVESMHDRKALMSELSDAFLALPGGLGTVEEIVEVWSWLNLGFITKPVGFLDVGGFWRPFLDAMGGLVEAEFLAPVGLSRVVVAPDLAGVLGSFESQGDPKETDRQRRPSRFTEHSQESVTQPSRLGPGCLDGR